MADKRHGLTYAETGVDIDAGAGLIKPLVCATARSGADAEIGGFGVGTVRAAHGTERVGYHGQFDLAW